MGFRDAHVELLVKRGELRWATMPTPPQPEVQQRAAEQQETPAGVKAQKSAPTRSEITELLLKIIRQGSADAALR